MKKLSKKIEKAKGWCIRVEDDEFCPTIFTTRKEAVKESKEIKNFDVKTKVVKCELIFIFYE